MDSHQRSKGKNVTENVEEDDQMAKYVGIAAVAGAALVGWGISRLFGDEAGKKMKAPGRPGTYISRGVFESNPSSYFRDLRKD